MLPSAGADVDERYELLGGHVRIAADGDATDDEFTVLELTLPPGYENSLHRHPPSEVFHVLSGTVRFHVNGRERRLEPDDTAYVGSGFPHGMRVVSDEVAEVLSVMTPAGTEAFVRAVGTPIDADADVQPYDPAEVDHEGTYEAGATYGYEYVDDLPE